MPVKLGFKTTGIETIVRRMQKVREKLATKTLRTGLGAVSAATVKLVKALAPVDEKGPAPGLYKKAIGRKQRVKKGKGYALVGARRGFSQKVGVRQSGKNKGYTIFQDPAKIGHLLEGGHGGPAPAPPHPHLRPGYELAKAAATRAIAKAGAQDLADAARG